MSVAQRLRSGLGYMVKNALLVGPGLLLTAVFAVTAHGSVALAVEAPRPIAEPDYALRLQACGKTESNDLHFVKAFRGLWPVPSNFVLIEHSDADLEYYDGANPAWTSTRGSRLLFLAKQSFQRSWPDLSQGVPDTERVEHQLTVRTFSSTANGPMTVVTDGNAYLVIYGPYGQAIKQALACYGDTVI